MGSPRGEESREEVFPERWKILSTGAVRFRAERLAGTKKIENTGGWGLADPRRVLALGLQARERALGLLA
jgi:hypothetical protein